MSLDHEAIYKAYADTVVTINDSAGAFDKDGNKVPPSWANSPLMTKLKKIGDHTFLLEA